MQKWQQKKRQKVHDSIIQNAKSSFRRYSNSRQKQQQLNASRSKPLSIPIPQPRQQIPINKILQIFQLQQYAHLLSMHKFMNTLVLLEDNDTQFHDMVMHVQEKDRERFGSLLHTLIVMARSIKNCDRNSDRGSKIKQGSKNTICYPPPQPVSTQSNKTPSSIPKSVNSQSKFRIKTKNIVNVNNLHTPKMEKNTKQDYLGHRSTLKQMQVLSDKTKKRRKSINLGQSKRKAMDDLTVIHKFQLTNNPKNKNPTGQLLPIQKTNKLLTRLYQKLSTLQQPTPSLQSYQTISLDMKKIQQMYLSFDSATLSSNIINIDLQQITFCLAKSIHSLLASYEIDNLVRSNQGKIKSLLRESFIIVREEEKESKTPFDSLRESQENVMEEVVVDQRQVGEYVDEDIGSPPSNTRQQHEDYSQQYTDTPTQSQNPQNLSIKLGDKSIQDGMASSIWGNNYIASIINDFSCFDQMCNSVTDKQPKADQIKNFIQLVMMAGKMEKQIPILAYVYIKRLLDNAPNAKLTSRNWKNITLVTLIQASKIWDDRSLENHSFSKVIKPYTTLQINRLEKYLLFFIDYKLNINQQEYSHSYFELRKYSGQPCHTANLVRLDLKTIKKLQLFEDQEGKEKIEKKQFLRKCMNKSF